LKAAAQARMPGVAANVPSSLTLIFSGNTRTFAEISAGTTRKGPEPSGAAIKPTALAPGTGEAGRGGRASRAGERARGGATGVGGGGAGGRADRREMGPGDWVRVGRSGL